MKQPPYHLRVNKAIDRFLLVEILDILKKYCEISDYTYYGFGGPFLEDCKLINERFPEVKIVSIETNQQIFRRQEFHRFSKKLVLIRENSVGFLANFSSDGREIFWFDYTDLKFRHFGDFMDILGKVSDNSIVKITVRAETPEPDKKTEWEDFKKKYEKILPPSWQTHIDTSLPFEELKNNFIKLLHKMFQIASQQALPASGESIFQILDSSYYNDQNNNMLSITGIICNKRKKIGNSTVV